MNQDVAWLQVAVEDHFGVQGVQALEHLVEHEFGLVLGELELADEHLEVGFDELHDDELFVVLGEHDVAEPRKGVGERAYWTMLGWPLNMLMTEISRSVVDCTPSWRSSSDVFMALMATTWLGERVPLWFGGSAP